MAKRRGQGEGSIYHMQDGRWRAAVTIGKDTAGKPRRKVFTATTRHEVKDELAKALRDQQLGIPIVSEKQTVARFLAHWLEQVVKARVRPKTFRTYSDLVKLHISPAIFVRSYGFPGPFERYAGSTLRLLRGAFCNEQLSRALLLQAVRLQAPKTSSPRFEDRAK